MKRIYIFTIIITILCSIYSFAEEDCTTKYQDLRNRVSGSDGVTKENLEKAYKMLDEAQKLCQEGKIKEANKIVESLRQEVALWTVFDPDKN